MGSDGVEKSVGDSRGILLSSCVLNENLVDAEYWDKN